MVDKKRNGDDKMNKVLYFQQLIKMLEELDIEKNDKETIKEVLNYIANELKKYINDI